MSNYVLFMLGLVSRSSRRDRRWHFRGILVRQSIALPPQLNHAFCSHNNNRRHISTQPHKGLPREGESLPQEPEGETYLPVYSLVAQSLSCQMLSIWRCISSLVFATTISGPSLPNQYRPRTANLPIPAMILRERANMNKSTISWRKNS